MVVVDTSVWASALLSDEVRHVVSREWLYAELGRESSSVAAPVLLVPELAGALARRTGNDALSQQLALGLLELPGLRLLPLGERLARAAALSAVALHLRGADAVFAAAAEANSATLVTWDEELLARAARVVPVMRPE